MVGLIHVFMSVIDLILLDTKQNILKMTYFLCHLLHYNIHHTFYLYETHDKQLCLCVIISIKYRKEETSVSSSPSLIFVVNLCANQFWLNQKESNISILSQLILNSLSSFNIRFFNHCLMRNYNYTCCSLERNATQYFHYSFIKI